MSKADKAREIVSTFLKVEPSEINDATVINASVIDSSIFLLRMRAALVNEGIPFKDDDEIETFGDLLNRLNGDEQGGKKGSKKKRGVDASTRKKPLSHDMEYRTGALSIGIDIEDIENMPVVDDFREDNFYKQKFSDREDAYCILQPDPVKSFAGKFSAKEAVIKADNAYGGRPLNKIEILNDKKGRPFFEDFIVSISHAEKQATAVAVRLMVRAVREKVIEKTGSGLSLEEVERMVQASLSGVEQKSGKMSKTSLIAILIALAAIVLAVWDKIL